MLFFLVHLVVRCLLRVLGGGSSAATLEVENAVLRHQLAVLGRVVKRVELRRTDRVLLADRQQASAEGTVVRVLGLAADAASLAPRAGREEVDVPAAVAGSAADRS